MVLQGVAANAILVAKSAGYNIPGKKGDMHTGPIMTQQWRVLSRVWPIGRPRSHTDTIISKIDLAVSKLHDIWY